MPEWDLQLILFLLCVGLFTAAAAAWDLRSRRIPNALTVPVFALGWVYQAVFHQWSGLADAGLGFAVGFGTLFVLWLVGGGGGGDVKLMGALSVWLGFRLTLYVMIASVAFVLVGTLAVLAWSMFTRGPLWTKRRYTANTATGKKGEKPAPETTEQRQQRRVMAYALPVALATWLVVIWKLPTL